MTRVVGRSRTALPHTHTHTHTQNELPQSPWLLAVFGENSLTLLIFNPSWFNFPFLPIRLPLTRRDSVSRPPRSTLCASTSLWPDPTGWLTNRIRSFNMATYWYLHAPTIKSGRNIKKDSRSDAQTAGKGDAVTALPRPIGPTYRLAVVLDLLRASFADLPQRRRYCADSPAHFVLTIRVSADLFVCRHRRVHARCLWPTARQHQSVTLCNHRVDWKRNPYRFDA